MRIVVDEEEPDTAMVAELSGFEVRPGGVYLLLLRPELNEEQYKEVLDILRRLCLGLTPPPVLCVLGTQTAEAVYSLPGASPQARAAFLDLAAQLAAAEAEEEEPALRGGHAQRSRPVRAEGVPLLQLVSSPDAQQTDKENV